LVGYVTKAIPRGKKGIAFKGENYWLPQCRHIVNKSEPLYSDTWFLFYNH